MPQSCSLCTVPLVCAGCDLIVLLRHGVPSSNDGIVESVPQGVWRRHNDVQALSGLKEDGIHGFTT
jgi:hypothetical protein